VKKLFIAVCILSTQFLYAQQSQNIRGVVSNSISKRPVEGASIQLFQDSEPMLGVATNSEGTFILETVSIGRYSLVISHVGYKVKVVEEVLVNSSKELVLEIFLIENETVLNEVVIDSKAATNDLKMIGKQEMTIEQTLRYAGNFYDPARLSTSFANVVAANDQANNLVIRGNSPNNMIWMLEGVNIVNPNHLTNAGTFSDRPSQNGGGVNILSSQILGNSNFLKGTFDASYGNSLSGVLDLSFKDGNNSRSEFMAQASLLGIEFAGEGPLGKKGASFLFNYRYSTVGLLSLMGVDFGGEKIEFQDISFKIASPAGKGKFTLFGIGGLSGNKFTAQRDSSQWEIEKDQRDIEYIGRMGALGVSYQIPIGKGTLFKTVVLYSSKKDERNASKLDFNYTLIPESVDSTYQEMISFRTDFTSRIGAGKELQYGILADHKSDKLGYHSIINGVLETTSYGNLDSWIIQPYLTFSDQFSAKFNYSVGVKYNYDDLSRKGIIEPRLLLAYNLNSSHGIYARFGLHGMQQLTSVYLAVVPGSSGISTTPNVNLEFTRSYNYSIGYNGSFGNAHFTSELYYQDLKNVPVETIASSFSVLNLLEQQTAITLENTGTGTNYGLDIQYRQSLIKDIYYLIGGSLFSSTYSGRDQIQRDAKYNGSYTFHFTGGKEFRKDKGSYSRTFETNLKFLYLGGFRDTPIDTFASAAQGKTIYLEDQAFEIKLKDYLRLDVRVAWTKNKPKYTRILSIDIQNILNITNEAYSYFDTFQGVTILNTQLGIIPVLAYRLEF